MPTLAPTDSGSVAQTVPHPSTSWFPGGILNTCYNAVDRHVRAGRALQPALIHHSAYTGHVQTLSYQDLLWRVGEVAALLRRHGVGKGSVVLVYLPMVPEAVYSMLACARLGAVHSVVFGGFAAKELAKRIDDCNPTILLTASCGIEPSRIIRYAPLVDEAVAIAKFKVKTRIVLQRPQMPQVLDVHKGEFDWDTEIASMKSADGGLVPPEPVAVQSSDPLYILYTSGSTGVPKGVTRDSGGHAVAMHWAVENVYGLKPGDVIFTASDIGWAVGHSFIVYGPLIAGCTTVMYEGKPVGTPDAGAFWRIVAQHNVSALFTAPTAIRAIKREDPDGELFVPIPTLRNLFLAGERSDTDTIHHFEKLLKVPVRDHYWQTETGWPITATCATHRPQTATPVRVGSAGPPVAGWDVRVLVPVVEDNPKGPYREARRNEAGNLVVKLPLPPGSLTTLWKNDAGFQKSYLTRYPGYFDLTDFGFMDEDGYVFIMSRTDDVINTAGHRLSTGAMEEIVCAHPAVAECAVVGARDTLKGEKPIAFVILKHIHPHSVSQHANTEKLEHKVEQELIAMVRDHIGPFACFDQVLFPNKLPKTRSGKILRRTLRAICNNESFAMPATIEDPDAIQDILVQFQAMQASQIKKSTQSKPKSKL